jgi:molybdate transport system substrate-binding protein
MRNHRRPAALAAAVGLVAACSSSTADPPRDRGLTVLAAASLTEAFAVIAEDFEANHPGVRVDLSFGPSDGLATQIREGAPADVFASASPSWMDDVANNGPGVAGRAVFARNRLVLITPGDNPAGISSLEDLAAPGVKLVLAASGVPAGDYARESLAKAGVVGGAESNVVSNEEDVKAVVQKVFLGEADAGIVYRTDVTEEVAPRLSVITIPEQHNVVAVFPIAVVGGSEQPGLARAFVEDVLGPSQTTLASFGFLPVADG